MPTLLRRLLAAGTGSPAMPEMASSPLAAPTGRYLGRFDLSRQAIADAFRHPSLRYLAARHTSPAALVQATETAGGHQERTVMSAQLAVEPASGRLFVVAGGEPRPADRQIAAR